MKITPFYEFFSDLINASYWQVLYVNMERGRFFIDIYDSSLIPLLILICFSPKYTILKILSIFSTIAVITLSLFSGFRSHLIMLISGVIPTICFILLSVRKELKIILISGVMFLLVVMFATVSYLSTIGAIQRASTIDRLVSPEDEDFSSIETRIWLWNKAYNMGFANPILGVGLGNFYDNLGLQVDNPKYNTVWRNKIREVTFTNPHNTFFQFLAENGLSGLVLFSLLLLSFIIYDSKILFGKETSLTKYIIISFWSLFIFSLANPAVNMQYLFTFWLLRGLIISANLVKL
jgi:O-antigen ligase